jgi:hypothetical protein
MRRWGTYVSDAGQNRLRWQGALAAAADPVPPPLGETGDWLPLLCPCDVDCTGMGRCAAETLVIGGQAVDGDMETLAGRGLRSLIAALLSLLLVGAVAAEAWAAGTDLWHWSPMNLGAACGAGAALWQCCGC